MFLVKAFYLQNFVDATMNVIKIFETSCKSQFSVGTRRCHSLFDFRSQYFDLYAKGYQSENQYS